MGVSKTWGPVLGSLCLGPAIDVDVFMINGA